MTELTITHTRAEGTLIEGTARGDGSAEILKVHRWRWSRNLRMWYVPKSRDHAAKTYFINGAAEALRAAGFEVEVSIDDQFRTTAEVEADRAERQEDRVAALHAKANRRAGQATAADTAAARAHEALPPMGEPIKVGHHSEGRHRRALDRAWSTMGKAVEAHKSAEQVALRAEAAEHTTAFRNNPNVIARRITRLEADKRRAERSLNGHTRTLFTDAQGRKHVETQNAASGAWAEQLNARIAEYDDQITYWRGELKNAQDDGALVFDRSMVRVGDTIRMSRMGWWPHPVRRINAKSVTVGTDYSWTNTVPYTDILGVRNANGDVVTFTGGKRSDEQ